MREVYELTEQALSEARQMNVKIFSDEMSSGV
jgi:hypothetical protein